ncbi:hypothetical protein LCGC14_1476590 [marine sediment metagenome]|uniref:Uncharacterized protein n=1 Tax=marine sediment metagenome TaxID=412755 RepID=A0A0F9JAT1_9ZZZZ
MRVLNFKAKKFIVGRNIVVKKTFVNGNVVLATGEIGKILSESIISLPDMNLFDIRVLEIEFSKNTVNLGESIAEEYMEMI